MSIATEIGRIAQAKADIKRAINAKGGTLVNEKLSAYAAAIDDLLPEEYGNRVRFIDYDGTVLKTMYVADGESATPPANPAHSGLVFQGWNTSLDDVLSDRDVGAVFTTASGAAEFDVRMLVRTGYTVTFYPYLESGTLTIDWGDGTTDTVTGTGKKTVSYTYADYGDYTIKMKVSSGGRWYIPDYFCNGSNGSYHLVRAKIADAYKLGNYAFYENYGLNYCLMSNDVTSVGEYAFYECRALQAVMLPPSLTAISRYAFYYCYALERIVFPDSVTTIPESICNCCHTLDCVTVPDGVESIQNYAFANCYCIERVGLPQSLRSIGYEAFREDHALGRVNFPDGLTSIGDSAFSNCYALGEEIRLPDSITSLGGYIFYYCRGITKINIPPNITRIPNGFCYRCYSLESLVIPSTVTQIGDEAFYECWRLTEVDVPATVTDLRGGCFRYCRSMKDYFFRRTTPPTLGSSNVFNDIPGSCRIWVPASPDREILTTYKTASNWSSYADYMYERNF